MITFKSVTKKFGDFTAVNSVQFEIEKGEFFALLGPNGAGKTTLVRMLLGFIKPTNGEILIDGVPADTVTSRKNIGYLAEHLKIPPYLSAKEYLKKHCTLIGLSGRESATEVNRVIELTGMTGRSDKKAATYSKGMCQRIGLAAAILGQPKLLLLDEPISGLDPLGIREVRDILADLNANGVTIILNSHLLSEVVKTCRSAGIINNGSLLIKDTIKNILNEDDNLEDVFIRYVQAQS